MHHSHNTPTTNMTRSLSSADKVARGLGWVSLGMGLYQLFAAPRLARQLGMEGHENKLRACGAREMISGIGALSDNPTPSIWGRVAGDTLNLAALTYALQDKHHPKRENLYLALAAVGALTAVDVCCAQALAKRHAYQGGITPDYSHRSGFPQGLESARGAARGYEVPSDMQDALPNPPI
ncbi:hypothetical protein B0H98_104261 [Vreelandella songnenensis]|uniref:Cyclase dehydrase n=1 Tax=Vreelandella songnenensis TaxID=1176243 RepID=A0A2T0V4A7_9GAMM|nr:hypothetical protein [Halomonas songnenensis]PRY64957.1 hypothetical protein B0H98_104261 [Halomonas songnenensis]